MYSVFLSFMSYDFCLFFSFKSCCYFFVRFCSWCYYVLCILTWCRLCLYLLMARKLDPIKDIDDKKETLKLVVRVKDLWFVQNRDNSRHMELILLDQKVMQLWCCFMCCCFMCLCCYFYAFFFQGDMIPAMVKKENLCLWEEKSGRGSNLYNA